MIEGEIAAFVTQFGMAGLIAWMWLSERRSSTARETQLSEAHTRIMDRHVQVEALMDLVAENTRAISSLESSQRTIGQLLDRVLGADDAARHGGGTIGG